MKEQTLMEVGFSKNEAKVYVSLLETGPASATKVAEVSGIHRVNVYDAIEKLKGRGLVGFLQNNGKRVFQASPPDTLLNIPKTMEIKIQNILPQLQLQHQLAASKSEVQIFDGYDFIRNMFLQFLETKEDILDLNCPRFVLQMVAKEFEEIIHKRRAQQKQMMYHVFDKSAVERMKFLNTLPYTKARYLEHGSEDNVTTSICGDVVAIQVYYENHSQKPLTIFIRNKQIAEVYRKNFFVIWEKAKEPKA